MSHHRWFTIGFLLCLLLLGSSSRVFAQKPVTFFDQISLEQGLSHSTVFSIVQDQTGFLWFGTQSGLNKYDGYDITVFRHDPNNPNSISNDNAGNLFIDRAGIIWIGTWGGGLNRLDPRSEQITVYRHDPNNPNSLGHDRVQTIFEDHAGNLWIGTSGGGLDKFDRQNDTFTHYYHDPDNPNSLSHDRIWRIAEDSAGHLWVATSDGLNRFDPDSDTFTYFKHDPADLRSLSHSLIRVLYVDSTDTLWVGTEEGLNRLNPDGETFTRFRYNPDSLSDDIINAILEDHTGQLWVGTSRGGLNKFHPETETFSHYTNDLQNPKSLSYNDIRWIHEDPAGILWLATRGGGVNKFNPALENFTYFTNDPDDLNSLSNNDVRAVLVDRAGQLWIGVRGGGLNKYDPIQQTFIHYRHDPDNPNSLSGDDVYALHQDQAGRIWVGLSGGGLMKFDPDTEQFTAYPYAPDDPTGLSSQDVNSIYEDQFGRLWIGTKGGGLNLFDPNSEQFTHYQYRPDDPASLGNDDVYAISAEPADTLWISTYGGGLNKLTLTPEAPSSAELVERIFRYQNDPNSPTSLSNNDVYAVYPDKQGYIWVGTANGGLNQFDPITQQFSRFSQANGFRSDVIYGILADDQDKLWLSTSKGLSKFDPQSERVVNYDSSDGLPSMGYSEGAYYKSPTGRLFFGGINGLLSFDPQQIRDNPHAPPVVLTGLTVANQAAATDQPPANLSQIELAYDDNILSFEFVALDYVNSTKNQYAYKLEGFDEDWVQAGTRRFATYTNLPPGDYLFRVKGSNNAGVWNETGASLAITIQPPFWGTWWFRAIALILGVGLILGGYRLRVMGIQAQRKRLENLVIERTVELVETNERLQSLTDHLQNELILAQDIQRSLLPPSRPDWDELDVVCYTAPAHHVGGDFYAYHRLDGDSADSGFALAVGDVSGKGLPAALLMGVSLASLQAVIGQSFSASQLLARLDQMMMPYTRTTQQNCALCYIELHGHTLRVANAACIAPLIKRAEGELTWVDVGGMPLGTGLDGPTGYETAELTLSVGDLIILTSDGVVEAFDAAGAMFGFDRLKAAVAAGPTGSAEAMLSHLKAEVTAFMGDTEPHDDLTIMVIRV